MNRPPFTRILFTSLLLACTVAGCSKDKPAPAEEKKATDESTAKANAAAPHGEAAAPQGEAAAQNAEAVKDQPAATGATEGKPPKEDAPAVAKTKPAPQPSLSPEAQVKKTLEDWYATQKRGGFKTYSDYYAPIFSGIRRTS